MVNFTLTLIRHGETDHNKKRIIQGQQDTELSEKGRRQAQLAGHRLMYERFTHAFASDLKRAYETCELILEANKLSTCEIVADSRIRERKFGVLEGKSCDLFAKEARKVKSRGSVHAYVPHGGESNKQVRVRAREFFTELCGNMKEVWDKEGNSGAPLAVAVAAAARRQRGTSSLCSNNSDVFVSGESPADNNNSAAPDLVLEGVAPPPAMPQPGKHDNSGSTSSTSGYSSSGGADSCDQLSPLEPGGGVSGGAPPSPGATIPVHADDQPLPASSPTGHFQQQFAQLTSQQQSAPGGVTAESSYKGSASLHVPLGCPNVSLSPIAEHRLISIPSISSGRGSFDDTDALLAATFTPEVLLVSHGGLIKEMILYFVDELGCELPGGREALIRTPYNTAISRFSVELGEDSKAQSVNCLLLNDKDHLLGQDFEILEKTDEV